MQQQVNSFLAITSSKMQLKTDQRETHTECSQVEVFLAVRVADSGLPPSIVVVPANPKLSLEPPWSVVTKQNHPDSLHGFTGRKR